MVDSSTVIDKRGYLFRFPTLGLPEPGAKGEDVVIRAAIGIKEKAIPLLKDDKVEAPRRYAGRGTIIFDVQYEGALWILPLLVPLKSAPETELFTVRVRRGQASTVPDPNRIKLPNTLSIVYMEHPWGMPSVQRPPSVKDQLQLPKRSRPVPTEADEEEFWDDDDLADLLGAVDLERNNVPEEAKIKVSSHLAEPYTYTEEEDRQRLKPPQAMTEDWQSKVVLQATMDRLKATGPFLSVSHSSASEVARLARRCGTSTPWFGIRTAHLRRREEWKPVPREAWKPGCELIMVNQNRKKLGVEPLTQDELTRALAAAEASRSTRSRE